MKKMKFGLKWMNIDLDFLPNLGLGGTMYRTVVGLLVGLCFGCSTQDGSVLQGKQSMPILSDFPYQCSGPYQGKPSQKLSEEKILKERGKIILQEAMAHAKWLKNSKDPEGHQANFCGANLSHGNFQGTHFKSAVFTMTALANANFSEAILNQGQFQGANLSGADFSTAQLGEANLDNAMLHLANFQKAILHKASISHAMLYKTNLRGVDLSEVKGLIQSQINMACLDKDTKLPEGLKRPDPC